MAALRKTFRYPSEDLSDEEDLDDEHQERLIETLRTTSAASDAFYRKLFLILPLGAALFSMYTFLIERRLTALLSLSSLACTAYTLHYLPLSPQDKKGKTAMYKVNAAKSPIEQYLPILNAGMVGLLVIAGTVSWMRGLGEAATREVLAVIVWAVAMYVRWEARGMDLEELEGRKYGLKGA
ncbi:uncharacterized protein RCC_06489 [Ramularia collo-cygni]|uniref:Uncharacterized protein n=1 Tax=Ramularia collo-cygni TaxID=112498 RepID=A0A2D3UVC9_9PEZI|nr:uncharacterized protein RCC_06489 [Ramularia collo-cygni]CZT20631.1 uncharacterized protein RCC_06489 [Ramularia collo-cygni]